MTLNVKAARREIETHQLFNHKNIIELLDSSIQEGEQGHTALLLFPFLNEGTLAERRTLMKETGSHFSEEKMLRIFLGICRAVQQFHILDPPLCHYDLKVSIS